MKKHRGCLELSETKLAAHIEHAGPRIRSMLAYQFTCSDGSSCDRMAARRAPKALFRQRLGGCSATTCSSLPQTQLSYGLLCFALASTAPIAPASGKGFQNGFS